MPAAKIKLVTRLVAIALLGAVVGFAVHVYAFGWPEFLQPAVAKLKAPSPKTAAQSARPPPEVGVMVVEPEEVPYPVEYAGRVAGFRDVEVRPRVGGILLKREFDEGAKVKEGQILFRIDPATYKVALDRAEAQLLNAQATLRQNEENYTRTAELERRKVSTTRQLDEAIAARDQARASVKLAEAEIEAAKLNLDYTEINAPVAGVTALESPPEGTLVVAQQTILTVITQLEPAYVNFSFTNEEAQFFRKQNERRAKPLTQEDLTVELHYGDGSVYAHPGKIDTAAQRVDARTGTIQARAIFPNPENTLLPGLFVRLVIRGVTLPEAIVIPDRAIAQGPQGPYVFVVGANDTAEVRPIRLGPELAQGWAVQDGLSGGERIVVDGVIRVRSGAAVRPVPVEAPKAQPSVSSSASSGGGSAGGPAGEVGAKESKSQGNAGGEANGNNGEKSGGKAGDKTEGDKQDKTEGKAGAPRP